VGFVEHIGTNDPWEEIIEENVLIVESNKLLDSFELQSGVVLHGSIMKAVMKNARSKRFEHFIEAHSLFRGLYNRVASKFNVDPSFVSRVAYGERNSKRIEDALHKEIERITVLLLKQKCNKDAINLDKTISGVTESFTPLSFLDLLVLKELHGIRMAGIAARGPIRN
jgi:hypothetical protein